MSDELSYHQNPDVICGDVDGELVAMNTSTGFYMHLNSSGRAVLSLLQAHGALALPALCERLLELYAVDATTCAAEVRTFLDRCIELDLVRTAGMDA